MAKYEKQFLSKLLDKYEKSKSFAGTNQVTQSFSLEIAKEIPDYKDDARYDIFRSVNESVDRLEKRHFVAVKKLRNGVKKSITLNTDAIPDIYVFLDRTPKTETNDALRDLLVSYCNGDSLLRAFCTEQLARIEQNKSVQHFDGDTHTFEMLLQAIHGILGLESETFERDFSVRLFGDSKVFDNKIKNKVISILFEYGDFAEKSTVLHELNLVSNPGHVFFKGSGIITIAGQTIDISLLHGDMALSTALLQDVEKIEVTGESVITIENLTTFNTFDAQNVFAIYLGGYHNTIRRNFIQKIFEQNQDKQYLHFGDIDAGGFYILMHLRRKTGVPFRPYKMDVSTLIQNMQCTKPLTDNDRKRLLYLKNDEFSGVIEYMLENNCKLEQEALD